MAFKCAEMISISDMPDFNCFIIGARGNECSIRREHDRFDRLAAAAKCLEIRTAEYIP